MRLKTKDRKYLVHGSEAFPIEVSKTVKNYVIDKEGKRYIDFFMGWCVGNIGWGQKEIKKAIREYKGPDYLAPGFIYQKNADLAELLAQIAPGHLTKTFRATGGSEAVELALRTANAYTKRHQFISIEGSYHGDTIGAMSVGSSNFRKHHPGLLFKTNKIKPPLNDKCADEVEKILKSKKIAALIMEPIICNLAVIIPEQIFMMRIQKLCEKYGTLLIIDEVATGFGRTGKMFASQHFGIKPDLMCLGKAITGGYAALGAMMTTEKIAKAMDFESSYYSTYGWHPLSVEAALANLRYLIRHQSSLEKNTMKMSEYFQDRLADIPFKSPVNIRAKGLTIGLEFKRKGYANQIVENARKNGLLVAPHSDCEFNMFPALNIDIKTAKKGLDILKRCA